MLDSKQREAHLLQARERLARAYARLETVASTLAERMRMIESSRDKSQLRVKEIEELLERERAITNQRQSLSDSATEELQALNAKLEKTEKILAERDKKIADLEKEIDSQNNEIFRYEKSHVESLEREDTLRELAAKLEEDNASLVRQLELLKEERENLHKHLEQAEQKENSYALMFTQDERLSLLKTIDSLIEKVDKVTGHHSENSK
jgi:chromosome segregation ATPase